MLRALRAFVGGLVEAGDRLWAMLPQPLAIAVDLMEEWVATLLRAGYVIEQGESGFRLHDRAFGCDGSGW